MSISQKVKQQISTYLSTNPEDNDLKTFLINILSDQTPQQAFHRLNLQTVKQPIIVFTKLMVQDIRENYYTYPFVIERPFSEKSRIWDFKFGNQQSEFSPELLQNKNYYSFIQDRETISCTPVIYESPWVKQVQKNIIKERNYEMVINQLNVFKLGEVFCTVCLYEPKTQRLHFLRKAKQEQIQKWQNVNEYLNKKIDPVEVRERILKKFSQVYSQKYSHFLLYSILSTSHLFISATESNVTLFKKILPRVCEVKIKVPFKESLFPYRKQSGNDNEILIQTPMQMSNDHTFVIIDFSSFSKDNIVKIQQQQIDNLKALKVFVEDGITIYRWLFGESLVEHIHTGLIVKASNIINPQYIIPEKVQQNKVMPEFTQQELRDFRCYIHQMRKIKPLLQKDRAEFQAKIHSEQKKFNQLSLTKVMQLSKLNAKSRGSEEIKLQDFDLGCELFF